MALGGLTSSTVVLLIARDFEPKEAHGRVVLVHDRQQ